MNKRIIIFIIALFFAFAADADWYSINSYNRVPAFSKIAKLGKVSIFVVSTSWCTPCEFLKDAIKDQDFDMLKVDIYIVNMAPEGYNYSNLKNTEAYYMWRGIENLDRWPTVYITSQTTNLKAIINDKGEEKDLITRINKVTNSLLEKNKYFHKELVSIDRYNINHEDLIENIDVSLDKSIKKITSDFNDINRSKESTIKNIKDSLISYEIYNSKINKVLKDSISELKICITNSSNDKDGVSKKLVFLQSLDISNRGILALEANKKERKRTDNHYKTSFIENIVYTRFSSLDSIETFIFKIKDINNSDYLILDNNKLEKEICLKNGTNNILSKVDLCIDKSKSFQFEIYKFGVLVLKSEYHFRR